MQLVDINIQNFFSIKQTQIEFDKGIISVTGQNKDVAGANSNGCGKSTLFDAISWALFGETLRPIDKDSVIRRGTNQCEVELIFNVAGMGYLINRRRGKETTVTFYSFPEGDLEKAEDLTGSTMPLTQSKINAVLGMDYKIFIAVATFDLDLLRFARATDKEQKEILERILELEIYGKALEKCRKEIAAKENTLSLINENKKFLDQSLKGYQKELDELQSQAKNYTLNAEARRQEAQGTIESFKAINEGLDRAIKTAKEEKDSLQKILALPAPKSKVLDALTNQNKIVSQLSWEFSSKQTALKSKELGIESASARIGQPCRECGRPIEESQVCHVIESGAEEVLKLLDELDALNKQIDLANLEANKLQQEYNNEQQEQMAANKARSDASGRINALDSTIRKCDLEQRENEKKILKLDMEVRSLEGMGEQFKIQQDKLEAKIANTMAQISEKNASYDIVVDGIAYLKYWEKGFGYQGIRSVMLDDVCQMLTEKSNNYLKHLMGGTLWIECTTTSANKSGELRDKLEIKTFNQYGAGTYYGNSKGEQQRIDIALALALQSIAKSRHKNPLGFAIYDEVFERLDSNGCEMIMSLLHKERNNLGTIFIVSNNPNLVVNLKTIEFVKQNGITICTKQEPLSKSTSQESQLPPSPKTMPVAETPSKKIGRPRKKAISSQV